MLTEPIGPRSPDEILAAVYRRTDQARRRRRQQFAAAVAVVALGLAGLASLQAGEEDAGRVRVVDRDDAEQEVANDEDAAAPTPAGDAPVAERTGGTTTTTTAPQSGGQPAPSGAGEAPAPTTPPVPTTTTTVTVPQPQVEVLAQTSDRANDSTMPAWYWDIVHGSMHMDLASEVVVFTTRYRTPSGSGTRDSRVLRTSFDMDNNTVTVSVTETNNTLGVVKLDGLDCAECTPAFDEAEGELRILVPTEKMSSHLQSLGSSMDDEVTGFLVATGPTDVGGVESDTAGGDA